MVAWISWMSSLKFVFHVLPSKVVLSIMDREQLPGLRRPARMSTQGEMTPARCSRKLFEVQNLRLLLRGRHQYHSLLYPPMPAGHESEQ